MNEDNPMTKDTKCKSPESCGCDPMCRFDEDTKDRGMPESMEDIVIKCVELFRITLQHELKNYSESRINQRIAEAAAKERELRELLALVFTGPAYLYTDDGELQDNSIQPFIDFKRDSIAEIKTKITERNAIRNGEGK